MYGTVRTRLLGALDDIREAGLWKGELVIDGPQGARLAVGGREVLNFCANNYLGSRATRPRARGGGVRQDRARMV